MTEKIGNYGELAKLLAQRLSPMGQAARSAHAAEKALTVSPEAQNSAEASGSLSGAERTNLRGAGKGKLLDIIV